MKSGRGPKLRATGLGLTARFVAASAGALALTMGLAAIVLFSYVQTVVRDTLLEAVKLNLDRPPYEQVGKTGTLDASGVEVFPIRYGNPPRAGMLLVYRRNDAKGVREETRFIAPDVSGVGGNMLGLLLVLLLLVVLVGVSVAVWAGRQVSLPLQRIAKDVRQIARGDLTHRTRVVGTGEIKVLARSIDRMTQDLNEAHDAHFELSLHEREIGLATSIRDTLLPLATPAVDGYDLGAARISTERIAGDFHDFVELGDGRVGLLVCDVSGKGVSAALVGAAARSYLRSELSRGKDVGDSLSRVNRWLQQDVRRGMFVTALYALISPSENRAAVACAGHKIPLLRYAGADRRLRVVHPEGIALGLDKGPVFDRRLQVQTVPLEVGDRLFLCNSAPLTLINAEGHELDDKTFYARVLKHAALDTPSFLRSLRRDLEHFVGGDIPADISLVTIARTG